MSSVSSSATSVSLGTAESASPNAANGTADRPLQIYFCGSVRGGRQDNLLYTKIVRMLQQYGHVSQPRICVLTECIIADDPDSTLMSDPTTEQYTPSLKKQRHAAWPDREELTMEQSIFQIDMDWLRDADVLVAEVSQPSLGVGFELGAAWRWRKPVLCLFRPSSGKNLSALIEGADTFTVIRYEGIEEVETNFKRFIDQHAGRCCAEPEPFP